MNDKKVEDKRSWRERLGVQKSGVMPNAPSVEIPSAVKTEDSSKQLSNKLKLQRDAAEKLAEERVIAARKRAEEVFSTSFSFMPQPPYKPIDPATGYKPIYSTSKKGVLVDAFQPVTPVGTPKLVFARDKTNIEVDQTLKSETTLAPKGIKQMRTIFIIHGRNSVLTESLRSFLRAINLKPMEFSTAIEETITHENKGGNPNIGSILNHVFGKAEVLIVLLSPDDEVQLTEELWTTREKVSEKKKQFQARPNVIFEAGMAYASRPEKTIFVTVGKVKEFSDIAGKHMMHLDNSSKSRRQLAKRLEKMGCAVELDGEDWEKAGTFKINTAKKNIVVKKSKGRAKTITDKKKNASQR